MKKTRDHLKKEAMHFNYKIKYIYEKVILQLNNKFYEFDEIINDLSFAQVYCCGYFVFQMIFLVLVP